KIEVLPSTGETFISGLLDFDLTGDYNFPSSNFRVNILGSGGQGEDEEGRGELSDTLVVTYQTLTDVIGVTRFHIEFKSDPDAVGLDNAMQMNEDGSWQSIYRIKGRLDLSGNPTIADTLEGTSNNWSSRQSPTSL